METQHTISELTTNNQMSDVQFLFGKYEELQAKLKKAEQMLEDSEKEKEFFKKHLDRAKDIIIEAYDDVKGTKEVLACYANEKTPKRTMIYKIVDALKNLDDIRINIEKSKFV